MEGKIRATPVVANGTLFCHDREQAVCDCEEVILGERLAASRR